MGKKNAEEKPTFRFLNNTDYSAAVEDRAFGALEKKLRSEDMVNRPPHYQNDLGVEVIDIIECYYKDNYHLGNAVKYLLRANFKGKKKEDLRKCVWYINRWLEEVDDE